MPGGDTWPVFLFGFLCLQITPVHSGIEKYCSIGSEIPHANGLCGPELPNMLQFICGGHYSRPYKRGIDESSDLGDIEDQFPRLSPLQGLILGKRQAFSYLGTTNSRSKRYTGIVCECCFNQCTISELYGYCGKRKKRDVIADQLPFKMND